MKTMIRTAALALLFSAASVVCAALPQINVVVADSSGKEAYKGRTDSKGLFASPKLQAGNYNVQFTSQSAPKGSRYTLVVAAGNKKVAANSIAAEKLAGGGVAMKIAVGAGLQVMTAMMAADVDALCGPRGRHDPDRTATRHGCETGSVTLGGRRLSVRRRHRPEIEYRRRSGQTCTHVGGTFELLVLGEGPAQLAVHCRKCRAVIIFEREPAEVPGPDAR